MTTKRIRCSCGRIYDPVKRPACPDCGAAHAVATAPEVPPQPPPAVVKPPVVEPVIPPTTPRPFSISPRIIAIGAGAAALLVLVIALSRCGSSKPTPVPKPTASPSSSPASASASPSAAPSASASATEATPIILPPPSGILESFDLSAAIAKAAPGATIKVPPGVYPGGLVVTKAVRLVGVMGQVFIQSEGRECLTVRAPGVAVQNVQFACNGIGELPAISVAQGADLELEACKVQSSTALGLAAAGAIKALGSSFAVASGTAVHLNGTARASFTQCSLGESQFGLWTANGATVELHSCAFDRNGGAEGKGGIISLTGAKTSLTADDCHFTNNTAGIRALDGATLAITRTSFKDNGATPREGAQLGLVVLFNGAQGALANNTFESNQQGVASVNGSKLEIEKCQFAGNGIQRNEILLCQPIGVYGKNALVTVRHSVITDSAEYAVDAIAFGKAILEDTEISGTRGPGLAIGDRSAGGGQAEVRRCQFLHNRTGVGLVAGSAATIDDSEFRDNQDGVIVLDKATHLRGTKLKFTGNTDAGLFVRLTGEAKVSDSDFMNNARGVISGLKGKSAERASLTLENCRFGGNRVFGAGACTQSELILTRCTFDGTDKLNIYKERSAIVQTDPIAGVSPTPSSTVSPLGTAEPTATATATPEPSATAQARRRVTPRPRQRRPAEDDVSRLIRRLLPPGP